MMVRNELGTTYTIVWSLALANVLGAGLCLFLSPGIARLTTIRFALVACTSSGSAGARTLIQYG